MSDESFNQKWERVIKSMPKNRDTESTPADHIPKELSEKETPKMTDEQIKHMVNRFLGWKLPENFAPDGGISFKATFNDGTPYQMKHNPSGTNLFDATQAEKMVRFMVEGLPSEKENEGG